MSRLVDVYANRKTRSFSIRDHKTKRVIDHRESVWLQDCTFTVQEGGRQRFLRTKHRNVHAWVTGTLIEVAPLLGITRWAHIHYNPKKHKSFRYGRNSIRKSELVSCDWFLGPKVMAVIDRDTTQPIAEWEVSYEKV